MRLNLHILPSRLVPAVCLLALSAVLTGCGPEQGGPLLPYGHNASLGDSGQFIGHIPSDIRHHARPVRVAQPGRRSRP